MSIRHTKKPGYGFSKQKHVEFWFALYLISWFDQNSWTGFVEFFLESNTLPTHWFIRTAVQALFHAFAFVCTYLMWFRRPSAVASFLSQRSHGYLPSECLESLWCLTASLVPKTIFKLFLMKISWASDIFTVILSSNSNINYIIISR